MKDVGVLVIGPPSRGTDATFRNDVAELEGRLRFIFTGWALEPVFGGEPLHPEERLIGSLALGRIHLHHVVDAGACVLVLLLVGDADAAVAAALARYADARVRPALPLFVLGSAEPRTSAGSSTLRLSGELRAMQRAHQVAATPIREEDKRFYAFSERIEVARDAVKRLGRDVAFRDDLRRHHHLRVVPGDASPPSWRLPPLQALALASITTSVLGAEELGRRARWLLGGGHDALDPRLAPRNGDGHAPGSLAERAVALAIRDVADERHASSAALGAELPGGANAGRVAVLLSALEDPEGTPAAPLPTVAGDDDAGALVAHLLQRAALRPVGGRPFLDPAQVRPASIAQTMAIAGFEDGCVVLRALEGASSENPGRLLESEGTAARLGFGVGAPALATFEATAPRVVGQSLRLEVPGGADALLNVWPADRLAWIAGRHADRLVALGRGLGFDVTNLGAPRTSASDPRSSAR